MISLITALASDAGVVTALITGMLVGAATTALLICTFGSRASPAPAPSPVAEEDTQLLDYLQSAKHSVFFNRDLAAWGVMLDDHQLFATAHTLRVTLARAIVKSSAAAAERGGV